MFCSYFGGGGSPFGRFGNLGFLFGAGSDASLESTLLMVAFFLGEVSVFLVVKISSSFTYPSRVADQDGGTSGEKGVPKGDTTAVRS